MTLKSIPRTVLEHKVAGTRSSVKINKLILTPSKLPVKTISKSSLSKTHSTDTLCENPSSSFLEMLNTNATLIQVWYRRILVTRADQLRVLSNDLIDIPSIDGSWDISRDIELINNFYSSKGSTIIEYADEFEEYIDSTVEETNEIPKDDHSDLVTQEPCEISDVQQKVVNLDAPFLLSLPALCIPEDLQNYYEPEGEILQVVPETSDQILAYKEDVPELVDEPVKIEENKLEAVKLEEVKIEVGNLEKDSVDRILAYLKSVQRPDIVKPIIPRDDEGAFDKVKQKILDSQLVMTQNSSLIETLRKQILTSQQNFEAALSDQKSGFKGKLNRERRELEAIIGRHELFITKILSEKEVLSTQIVSLSQSYNSVENQAEVRRKNQEIEFERQLAHQRESLKSSEKIRRDKWMSEKSKSIKDLTLQSLEPEIQKLISNQKLQLQSLENDLQARFAQEKQALLDTYQRQTEMQREKANHERQRGCEEEREFSRQRYLQQQERDSTEQDLKKRKVENEFKEEKLGMIESGKQAIRNGEIEFKRREDALRAEIDRERMDAKKQRDDLNRKSENEMVELRERLAAELEEWQSSYIKRTEIQNKKRDKKFRDEIVEQRDAEIEVIIERFELEGGSSSSDVTRSHRLDIEKLKTQNAEEGKELRTQHNFALDKLLNSKQVNSELEQELRKTQKECLRLQHLVETKEILLKTIDSEMERLTGDERLLKLKIRADFEEEVQEFQSSIKKLTIQIAAMEVSNDTKCSQLKMQVVQATRDKEMCLNIVESQVIETVKAKDAIIDTINQQNIDLKKRVCHLESLIESQRSELLGL